MILGRPTWVAVTTLLLLPIRPAGLAQQPETPVFRGGVDLVMLDVSVLDRNRRPVTGLEASNFTVLEDGRPQHVVAFNAVDRAAGPLRPAPWPRDVAPDVVSNPLDGGRLIVIVLDDAHTGTDPWMAAQARAVAHAVIDRVEGSDLASVTFTDEGRWQGFTSDRARLAAAVDSFRAHPEPAGPGALQNRYRSERLAGQGNTSPDPPPTCTYGGKSRGVGSCVISTLNTVADALASAPQGRKTVVYIGNGIPYDFSTSDLRGWRSPGDDMAELQATLQAFQRANINIQTFDPCGTKCGLFGAQQDFLRVLAEETGGRATLGTNVPQAGVPQVFIESDSYYLLGFRSDNPSPGRFRRLDVKVDRPGVEVHTRSGYYGPARGRERPTGAPDVRGPADRALAEGVPGGDLPLSVHVAPIAARGRTDAVLAVTVAFGEPLPVGGRVEVVTTAVDASCPTCNRQTHRQTIEVAQPPPAARAGSTHQVLSRLQVKPGRYQIRVAAAAGDRTGRVFADVEVPDFARSALAVSGVVLSVSPGTMTAHAALLGDVMPIVPSATRTFRSGMAASAFLRIRQGGARPPASVRLSATIRGDGDLLAFDRVQLFDAAAFSAGRSTDYRLDLPISALVPGRYLLTFDVSLGEVRERRDVPFRIE